MHRRKRISPVLIIAGIVVVVAVGILLMGRLDFPGRVLRAISSLVPSNAEKPLESEEVEDYRAMVRDLERENTILREMLLQYRSEDAISKLEPSFGYPVLPATVIYRDHSRLFDSAIINVGSSDGVEVNMPVIDSAGLVGRVVSTRGTVSRILLITSPDCAFGVRDTRSRELGVTRGSRTVRWWVDRDMQSGVANPPPNMLELSYLSPSAEIRVQDVIVTSGLSGITPPGIRVGEVATIISLEEQGRFEIHVRPFADFEHLENVGVILYREEDRLELEDLIEETGGTVGSPM